MLSTAADCSSDPFAWPLEEQTLRIEFAVALLEVDETAERNG